MSKYSSTHTYDLIVVGCGGWGLAVLKVLRDDFVLTVSEQEGRTRARPGRYLVGALAKKHLEHIGLNDNLCPGNEGIRHINKVIDAIKIQLNNP